MITTKVHDGFTWVLKDNKWVIDVEASGGPPSPFDKPPTPPPLPRPNKIRLAVVGSRTFTGEDNYNLLFNTIASHFDLNKIEYIVSGKASGADSLGARFANQCKIPLKEFPADWENLTAEPCIIKRNDHGRKYNALAGHNRNQLIVDNCSHLVAFWSGSAGTRNSINLALKQKKPVLIIPF